jgi:hypothetical protein
LIIVAPCEEEMVYENTYPKTVSSNEEGKSGLTDDNDAPWSPSEDDLEKSVIVTVSEEIEYIDSVLISETTGVSSVVVSVIDEDGNEEVIMYFNSKWVELIIYIIFENIFSL